MPERFDLQVQQPNGAWISEVLSGADQFERQEDGSYVCSPGYTQITIRCIERGPDHFIHVDGDGNRFKYRVVPLTASGPNS